MGKFLIFSAATVAVTYYRTGGSALGVEVAVVALVLLGLASNFVAQAPAKVHPLCKAPRPVTSADRWR